MRWSTDIPVVLRRLARHGGEESSSSSLQYASSPSSELAQFDERSAQEAAPPATQGPSRGKVAGSPAAAWPAGVQFERVGSGARTISGCPTRPRKRRAGTGFRPTAGRPSVVTTGRSFTHSTRSWLMNAGRSYIKRCCSIHSRKVSMLRSPQRHPNAGPCGCKTINGPLDTGADENGPPPAPRLQGCAAEADAAQPVRQRTMGLMQQVGAQ